MTVISRVEFLARKLRVEAHLLQYFLTIKKIDDFSKQIRIRLVIVAWKKIALKLSSVRIL